MSVNERFWWWICNDSQWVAVPKCHTAIIAWDIGPFTPIACGATEGYDVSLDASEGDGESKKSSSETHGMLVILTLAVCQLQVERRSGFYLYLKRIYDYRPESGLFRIICVRLAGTIGGIFFFASMSSCFPPNPMTDWQRVVFFEFTSFSFLTREQLESINARILLRVWSIIVLVHVLRIDGTL